MTDIGPLMWNVINGLLSVSLRPAASLTRSPLLYTALVLQLLPATTTTTTANT